MEMFLECNEWKVCKIKKVEMYLKMLRIAFVGLVKYVTIGMSMHPNYFFVENAVGIRKNKTKEQTLRKKYIRKENN